ncbi:MAG: ATP synthase F1 subunit delta [Holosporales bacterium]|nr:ATP synthase F1 subunit delta [Holosporales bacterium]
MSSFAKLRIVEQCVGVLVEVAKREGVLPQVVKDFSKMKQILAARELDTIQENCRISAVYENNVARCLIEVLHLSPLVERFLLFIAEKHFLECLKDIMHQFLFSVRAHEKHQNVTFFTAAKLEAADYRSLTKKLQDIFGEKIDPIFAVDPSLISGFKIQKGSKIADFSFKSHLRYLEAELKGQHA